MFSNWLEQFRGIGNEAIKYIIIFDIVKLIVKVIAIKFFINNL